MIKRNANVNVKNQRALRRLLVLVAIVLVGGGLACCGAAIGFQALRNVWLEQFRVQDPAIDVVVTTPGGNVTPETVTQLFDLTNGANLATIAPSISAALVTTVVGLLIAIPGVIAYNRMSAKIRNLVSDMEGFSDELIGRIACEFQGRGA